MVIQRDLYLNKLISRRLNGLIKVVTGVRRCGKSAVELPPVRGNPYNGEHHFQRIENQGL